jgi:phosphate-selective porin OprO/OprP
MSIKRKLLILSLLIAITGFLQAQTRNVSGVITSNVDGKPIAGVSVRLKGAIAAATTNDSGFYTVAVDEKSTETLIFTHPDFDDMEVVVIGKSKLDLSLSSNVRLNQYGQKVNRNPLVSEERNGVLTFESKDKSYKFWTDIRVNVDFTKHFDNYDNDLSITGNPMDAIQLSDGGHVRRARIGFKAQVSEKWYGEIDIDVRDIELDMNDIYLQYSVNKNLELKFGHFREPFGMMTNTTSRYVTFMERPLSSEFDPSRHLGIAAKYSHPWFATGLGVFTDEAYGIEAKDVRRKQRTGAESSWAVTGRFMGYPLKDDNLLLGIGVGGSYRTPMITDEGFNTVRVRVNDENRTSQKRFLDTDAVKNVKKIILANAELAFAFKSFRLQGEYKIMTLDRGAIYTDINYTGQNLNDAQYSGYYVELGYYLFGDRPNFNFGDGEFTRVNPKSKMGTIELAARYSTINLNDADAAVFGGEGKISSIGVTYWAQKNVRIILNAAYVDHDEHASTKYKWNVPAGGFDYVWVATRFEIDF